MILKPFEDQQDTALVSMLRSSLRPRLFARHIDTVPADAAHEQNQFKWDPRTGIDPIGPSLAV
jgi:hypothetical protein